MVTPAEVAAVAATVAAAEIDVAAEGAAAVCLVVRSWRKAWKSEVASTRTG